MKKPSQNMSRSLRGQKPAMHSMETVSISRQRAESAADRIIPGEGGVEDPPGPTPTGSAKVYAQAMGKVFGGGK